MANWTRKQLFGFTERFNRKMSVKQFVKVSNKKGYSISAVLDVSPTDIRVSVPYGFDLEGYTRELSFPVGDDVKLKVLFYDQADIDRLRETPIFEDQKIIDKNEGWQLQATIGNSYQLRWWLRGCGERVEVLGPKSLRQEFVDTAIATAKRYPQSQD